MRARIVVDENVPLARDAFAPLGDVALLPGRAIGAEHVRDATALVVRSVTRIDERLLAGSRVEFVGTATIGVDHVDTAFLARAGIAFAYAPGSNARSVAEYVTAALLELETQLERSWAGRVLGVVGVGHVGTLVVAMARAIGMDVLCCDPPRAEAEGERGFVGWQETLDAAEVLTLHTPLVEAGRHRTHHLVGAAELARLRPGAVLLNTARGAVVDGGALGPALARGGLGAAVLDVFENEPTPDPALVQAARLATPHIAGYSLDGKIAGTRMIAAALARHLDAATPRVELSAGALPHGVAVAPRGSGREAVREAVRTAYSIVADDGRMRAAVDLPPAERAAAFDRLRREYPVRREFPSFVVASPHLDAAARRTLADLGFGLA